MIRPRLVRARGVLGGMVGSILGAGALTACTTLGGNVKGDFACRAPDGVCAPSATIDDRALALISGEDGDRLVSPAGPYSEPPAKGRGFQKASLPVRTRERVLRIVFPAQIDAAGRLHEQTAVHAVVEQGEWVEALAANAVATTRADVAAVTGADTLLAAVERAEPALIDTLPADADAPSAEAVTLARAQSQTPVGSGRAVNTDPVGDIKDQVARTLLTPRRSAAAPSTAKPVVTSNGPPAAPTSGAPPGQVPAPAATNRSGAGPVAGGSAAIPIPALATPVGQAAITAVATNPAVRSGLDRGESDAQAAAPDPTVRILRAAPFQGLQP